MDKYTVDLDKILDDFEFDEVHCNGNDPAINVPKEVNNRTAITNASSTKPVGVGPGTSGSLAFSTEMLKNLGPSGYEYTYDARTESAIGNGTWSSYGADLVAETAASSDHIKSNSHGKSAVLNVFNSLNEYIQTELPSVPSVQTPDVLRSIFDSNQTDDLKSSVKDLTQPSAELVCFDNETNELLEETEKSNIEICETDRAIDGELDRLSDDLNRLNDVTLNDIDKSLILDREIIEKVGQTIRDTPEVMEIAMVVAEKSLVNFSLDVEFDDDDIEKCLETLEDDESLRELLQNEDKKKIDEIVDENVTILKEKMNVDEEKCGNDEENNPKIDNNDNNDRNETSETICNGSEMNTLIVTNEEVNLKEETNENSSSASKNPFDSESDDDDGKDKPTLTTIENDNKNVNDLIESTSANETNNDRQFQNSENQEKNERDNEDPTATDNDKNEAIENTGMIEATQANVTIEPVEMVETLRIKPKLSRPNSLDLSASHSSQLGPPGKTPVNHQKYDVKHDDEFANKVDLSPADSNLSSAETSILEDLPTDDVACKNDVECANDEPVVDSVHVDSGGVRDPMATNDVGFGKKPPYWIPDADASCCMHCGFKFTVIKRRHHCRACGFVLCKKCCGMKWKLEYLGETDARVCNQCYDILSKETVTNAADMSSGDSLNSSPAHMVGHSPNAGIRPHPNNPQDYCSTLPVAEQIDQQRSTSPPSVMVPVGVLKRHGSERSRENKQVIFFDGVRPGSDGTVVDSRRCSKRVSTPMGSRIKINNAPPLDAKTLSYIPHDEKQLPPIVSYENFDAIYKECANNLEIVNRLKNEQVTFALQRNLEVHVKIIDMNCCISKMAWCFTTKGLSYVGQDEVIILLECLEQDEETVPRDLFVYLNNVYVNACKGIIIKELNFSLESKENFLGDKCHMGFLYVHATYQCLKNVILPPAPYIFGVLVHKWEIPWAKVFPLRLMLRLGAEYRYYPCPLISTRFRDAVYGEVGHTILNVLADFRNFSYTLPNVRGLTIHMEDKQTIVSIPKNRYDQVLRALSSDPSDNILAFAGHFSRCADSHLVCIQDTEKEDVYTTHAIDIQNKPRRIIGASFIILNNTLKSDAGLLAKSNIIEDGLMIQILPEQMSRLREALKNMESFEINCGSIASTENNETVCIVWSDNDLDFNVGVLSPIDEMKMDGIESIRLHNTTDYTSTNRVIRWTEVFLIKNGDEETRAYDIDEIQKISEIIAKATCTALLMFLDMLASKSLTKLAIRVNLHNEDMSYEAGANGVKLTPIYMNALDDHLVPALNTINCNNTDVPLQIELIFHILNL